MLYTASDPIHDVYQVRKFPATILIDAQGVIRARDLSWDQMVELADRLVAEAEKTAPKK